MAESKARDGAAGFNIRLASAGDPAACTYCKSPLDIEGRGVMLLDGAIATTGRGQPVCRVCLEKRDPAFAARFIELRRRDDDEERLFLERRQGARARRRDSVSQAKGSADVRTGRELDVLDDEVSAALLMHPDHLAARRALAMAAATLAAARGVELDAATRAQSTRLTAAEVDQAEAEVAEAEARSAAAGAELRRAEEALDDTDARLRRELLGDTAGLPPFPRGLRDKRAEVPPAAGGGLRRVGGMH